MQPPCGYTDHAVCASCLFRIVTAWYAHPIGPGSPEVQCPHDGCLSCYPTAAFEALLPAADMARLRARAERFAVSAHTTVGCPVCALPCVVATARLANAQSGTVVVSPRCGHPRFCYHCLDSCTVAVNGLNVTACLHCLEPYRTPRPGEFNRYFRRPGKTQDDGLSVLMRNVELNPDLCVARLLAIAAEGPLHEVCAGCSAPLHKSEECNDLGHCMIHCCWHCGYTGMEGERLGLIDHWDPAGIHGCPRFDTDSYWAAIECATLCDVSCQSAAHDCTVGAHQARIARADFVRKVAHIDAHFDSLPPAYRAVVRARIEQILAADRDAAAASVVYAAILGGRPVASGVADPVASPVATPVAAPVAAPDASRGGLPGTVPGTVSV